MPTATAISKFDGDDGRRILVKENSDGGGKDGHDDPDEEVDDGLKKDSGSGVDNLTRQLPHHLSLVPGAQDQRSKIVGGSNEDRAKDHPKQRRRPTPDDRYGRADDGCGARDRSVVGAPKECVCP